MEKSDAPALIKEVSFHIKPVHQLPTEKSNKLRQVAKITQTALGVASHIARLKHEKPRPKDLSTQYDQELKHLYLMEWPDAVPQYHSEHLCCCYCQSCCCCCQPCYRYYDPEREKDTRELFKRVFPSFIFNFLVFTGAIPAGSKKCNILVKAFWYLIGGLFAATPLIGPIWIYIFGVCAMDVNCSPVFETGFTSLFGTLFLMISIAITIFLVPTYLQRRFQSRELQTLISSIGPGRVGFPTYCW